MIRYLFAAAILLISVTAQAQQADHTHSSMVNHGAAATEAPPLSARPQETGQAAFAAIQEIVSLLDANPHTDWSNVDIEALRRHLVDMTNVTLYAHSVATPVENGMRFSVTGNGPVRESIRRMVEAHAKTMTGWNGWSFAAEESPEGAVLTVTVPRTADLDKLKGLGFIGVMAYGAHHQQHHLMIATGQAPHE